MASRISRNEQKKAVQQSVVYVALAIGIIALFIFAILPFSIRMFDRVISRKSVTTGNGDTIPPQVPIMNSLPTATNSAKLVVSGFGESDSKMVLFQNGNMVEETMADGDGAFFFKDIPFQDGENVMYVVSSDTDENSSQSQMFTVVLDTAAPALTIEQPTDGSTVTERKNQLATVKGTTDKGARVSLNDKVVFTDSTGGFSTTFQLQPGENILNFRAIDTAGNVTEKQMKVSYNQ